MSDNPNSLIAQLAARTKSFLIANNITQRELCKLLKLDAGNFSKFLKGQLGLSAETTLQLVRLMNLSQRDSQLKFGAPEKTRARIMNLQVKGQPMRFDGLGWVSGQSGTDPVNSTSITDTWKEGGAPSGDDIIDVLREVQNLHRAAIKSIDDYIAGAQKAKPNKDGVTEGLRKVNTNTKSSYPGSRRDMLATPEKLKEQIAFVKKERAQTEEQLRLEAELQKERELYWDARIEAARKELKAR